MNLSQDRWPDVFDALLDDGLRMAEFLAQHWSDKERSLSPADKMAVRDAIRRALRSPDLANSHLERALAVAEDLFTHLEQRGIFRDDFETILTASYESVPSPNVELTPRLRSLLASGSQLTPSERRQLTLWGTKLLREGGLARDAAAAFTTPHDIDSVAHSWNNEMQTRLLPGAHFPISDPEAFISASLACSVPQDRTEIVASKRSTGHLPDIKRPPAWLRHVEPRDIVAIRELARAFEGLGFKGESKKRLRDVINAAVLAIDGLPSDMGRAFVLYFTRNPYDQITSHILPELRKKYPELQYDALQHSLNVLREKGEQLRQPAPLRRLYQHVRASSIFARIYETITRALTFLAPNMKAIASVGLAALLILLTLRSCNETFTPGPETGSRGTAVWSRIPFRARGSEPQDPPPPPPEWLSVVGHLMRFELVASNSTVFHEHHRQIPIHIENNRITMDFADEITHESWATDPGWETGHCEGIAVDLDVVLLCFAASKNTNEYIIHVGRLQKPDGAVYGATWIIANGMMAMYDPQVTFRIEGGVPNTAQEANDVLPPDWFEMPPRVCRGANGGTDICTEIAFLLRDDPHYPH